MGRGGLRVVVLDERRVVREAVGEVLTELGFRVLFTAHPDDGASLAVPGAVDVVVCGAVPVMVDVPRVSVEGFDVRDGRRMGDLVDAAAAGAVSDHWAVDDEADGGDEPDSPADHLSPRERAVLTCVAQGMTAQQTAVALGVSERSVVNAKRRIFAKLGASSQAEAVSADRRLRPAVAS